MNLSTISLSSKQFYQYRNKKIEYNLIRSKRRKTSEIIVDENEIIVRIPLDKSLYEVEKLLSSKIRWILEKQDQYSKKEEMIQIPSTTFLHNSTLPYLGKNYRIKLVDQNSKNNLIDSKYNNNDTIEFKNDTFVIWISKADDTNYAHTKIQEKIKSLYGRWIEEQANILFVPKIKKFSHNIDVSPQGYKIKFLRNRWGSLTKKGTIILNVNLVKASEEIIDYIIIHELCHLKIQGHSHYFWRFLKQFEPDYEKKIKWLELNGKNILLS